MNQSFRTALTLLVVLVGIGGGIYVYTTREVKAPSAQAPETGAPAGTQSATTLTAQNNEQIFRISPEGSKTEYRLGELLRGEPVTVIGTTNQVEGSIAVNRANLPESRFSTIRVNARTFKTDNDRRDNAVQRMILKSEQDAFEYIEFKPKSLKAPATAENGQMFEVEILGDLTIAGTTREATFKGTAQFNNDNELVGDVESTLTYGDYGISVPNLPFLANVDKQTTLKFHFNAKR